MGASSAVGMSGCVQEEFGRLLLSKTEVSRLKERLWEDYHAFAKRDLSE
jgi:hypothetical protein